MKAFTSFIFVLVIALLAGCSTSPGKPYWKDDASLTDYNPQNYQGCTVGEYIKTDGDTIRWWDCKDKAQVAGSVDLSGDGTPDFNYSASDVVGSDAAALRAQVEQAFAEAGVQIIPDVVDQIVNSLKPAQ